jgi:hypothetical protein
VETSHASQLISAWQIPHCMDRYRAYIKDTHDTMMYLQQLFLNVKGTDGQMLGGRKGAL